MLSVRSAISSTVSITSFNRGLAGKIFEAVKKEGAKVVMKNNAAECVLLSPEEYLKMIDEINDARLLFMAEDRLKEKNTPVSAAEFDAAFGITEADLEGFEDVEIE